MLSFTSSFPPFPTPQLVLPSTPAPRSSRPFVYIWPAKTGFGRTPPAARPSGGVSPAPAREAGFGSRRTEQDRVASFTRVRSLDFWSMTCKGMAPILGEERGNVGVSRRAAAVLPRYAGTAAGWPTLTVPLYSPAARAAGSVPSASSVTSPLSTTPARHRQKPHRHHGRNANHGLAMSGCTISITFLPLLLLVGAQWPDSCSEARGTGGVGGACRDRTNSFRTSGSPAAEPPAPPQAITTRRAAQPFLED
jgi:hypothetical protein